MTNLKANEYDKQVAANLRHHRRGRNISMDAVAAELNTALQQIQKYETGVNRISAGRLKQVSLFLEIPLQDFYDEPDIHIPEKLRQSCAGMARDFSTIEDKDIITIIRTLINKFKKGLKS